MSLETLPRRGIEVLEAARALQPLIRAEAEEIEKSGRLTDAVVHGMRDANVFGMAMPRAMGGIEADPITQLEVVEALSVGDGSVGWVAMIGSDGGFYAAHLPEAVANEMYADPNVVTASVLVPRGQARPVAGGYRVSGHWPFGSAGLHAGWFGGGCLVMDGNQPAKDPQGHPIVRTLFFPRDEVRIHDNWQTTGLSGSGSNDWSVDDVFVPEGRSLSLFEPARFDTPLFAFPWFIIANAPGASLGIARAAIDDLVTLAAEKIVMPGGKRLQDDLLVQTAIGHAEAELGAARAFILEATGAIWAAVCAGREPTLAERARFRLAGIHSFRASKSVVARMYEAGGGSALYARSPLDRHWRDISTITQHAFANERGYGEGARALMGLDPESMLI
jgi:alkylation response protein AidB-like acyl-CoA dehydrogenase